MVAEFARRLRWGTIELIVSHFQERLQFGVQRELCELMRLPSLNGVRARALFNAGFTSLPEVATCDVSALEAALLAATPFQSRGQGAGETDHEAEQRKRHLAVWVTGRSGLTTRAAAEILVKEARDVLELEMGVGAKWDSSKKSEKIVRSPEKSTSSGHRISQNPSSRLATESENDIANCIKGDALKKVEVRNNPSSASQKTTNQVLSESENSSKLVFPGLISIKTPEKGVAAPEPVSEDIRIPSPIDHNVSGPKSAESSLNHHISPLASDRMEKRLKTPGKDSTEITSPPNGALATKHHETITSDKNIVTHVVKNVKVCADAEEDLLNVEPEIKNSTVLKTNGSITNVSNFDDIIMESCCDWESFSKENPCDSGVKDLNQSAEISCFGNKLPSDDEGTTKTKEAQNIDLFTAKLDVDPISTVVGETKPINSPPAVVRNRFSTDIFDVSPKPSSTPLAVSKSSATVNSPDLFSQSLTFDTQLQQVFDSEEPGEDAPSSPPKSDDLGYLSDSSPVIIAEISNADTLPRMAETVGESFFINGRVQGSALKRKASPDVIAGSDDSMVEEGTRSKRTKLGKSVLFRSRSRRPVKQARKDVAVVSLEESDEEIAPTPHVERICSFASKRGQTLRKKILSKLMFWSKYLS